jgi:hypothetical protein
MCRICREVRRDALSLRHLWIPAKNVGNDTSKHHSSIHVTPAEAGIQTMDSGGGTHGDAFPTDNGFLFIIIFLLYRVQLF